MSFLTKSDFKLARTCSTKLYYKKLKYPTTQDDDEYLELLEHGGYMIGAIAKLLFPEAIAVNERESQRALQATQELIRQENVTLLEAAFLSNGKFARPDILLKHGNHFTIIEVKAKSYDGAEAQERRNAGKPNPFRNVRKGEITPNWRPYLEDVTFQALILRELFPQAKIACELMMPDTSLATSIDKLYSLFELEQLTLDETGYPRASVTFTGDVNQLRRDHFLTRLNVDAEVAELMQTVASAAETFVNSLQPLTKIPTPLSLNCSDCEYQVATTEKQNGYRECWGALADVKPHIFEMYRLGQIANGGLAERLIAEGKVSLFAIPETALVKKDGTAGEWDKRRLLQIRHTQANTEWIDPALSGLLESFTYPLYFIDFETSALAVPYHAGMHPYENVAFQWSCHTLRSPDAEPEHAEWINVEDAFPNFAFAESLMKHLGTRGTFFMWAPHENTTLKGVRRQMDGRYDNAEIKGWLEWLTDDGKGEGRSRLVDMNALTLKYYFHPIMKGKTSIKKVVDAIWKTTPALRQRFPAYIKEQSHDILSPYQSLPPLVIDGEEVSVSEGTGAIRAYQAMLYGKEKSNPIVREQWKKLLLQYCQLDTLAMVMVYLHWREYALA